MINREMIQKKFQNHVATLAQSDQDIQILIWKQPRSRVYEIDYIFWHNMVFITGDLQDAILNCTWVPKWDDDWANMELDYFAGKITAHAGQKYVWDCNKAIKDIYDTYYINIFEDFPQSIYDEFFEYISNYTHFYKYDQVRSNDYLMRYGFLENEYASILEMSLAISAARMASSESNFTSLLQEQEQKYLNHTSSTWNYLYQCGTSISPDVKFYLIGLQMASDQLSVKDRQ